MRSCILSIVLIAAFSSAIHAQDISIIRWEPVVRPGKIVFVPRGGPIRRCLFGPYAIVVVPKDKEPAK